MLCSILSQDVSFRQIVFEQIVFEQIVFERNDLARLVARAARH
jgi:hypothetical protein